MTDQVSVLAVSGSTREDSYNSAILEVAIQGVQEAGAQITLLRLRDFPLPLYDGDLEAAGLPDHVRMLKQMFRDHDGFLIASPEYNGFFSGVLKNALDWLSRPVPDEPSLAAFKGKTAAIMAASPGALGGIRGLMALRQLLSNLQVTVLPEQVIVPHANRVLDADGNVRDEKVVSQLIGLGTVLARATARWQREETDDAP